MTKSNRSALYLLYQNGDIPNASNFQDLIDTPLWISASGQPALESSASFQAGSGISLTQTGSVIKIDATGGGSAFQLSASTGTPLTSTACLQSGSNIELSQSGSVIVVAVASNVNIFGKLGIGTSAPGQSLEVIGGFKLAQAATFFPEFSVVENTFGIGAQVLWRLARGAALTSPCVNVNGDTIGNFLFQGYDTVDYQTAAIISANVDGTPTAGCMPGRMGLWTTPQGATTATERMRINNQGLVKIGDAISSPSARFHVTEATAGSELMRLELTAANTDPRESTFIQKALSVSASIVVDIATIAIPASTVMGIKTEVTVRRTGGTAGSADQGGFFGKVAAFKNISGTASQIGATTDMWADIEDQGWSVTIAASGGNALIKFTGTANNNISIGCVYRAYPMGT